MFNANGNIIMVLQEGLVTELTIFRQSFEVPSIIRLLQARIAEQDLRIAALEAEVTALRTAPWSSLTPRSTERPRAKSSREKE